MKDTYKDFIAKPEVSFWVPMIFTAVSITISFMSLNSKVDLISQKLDRLIEDQREMVSWKKQYEQRLGMSENQISVLQTQLNIKQ